MNLIEKITEPTFTNSSKGLLTLFCIGLFQFAIGVDLTSTEVTIPWLPSINFPHIERITYLYWALVAFSLYRYSLHHFPVMRMHYFLAMGRFFRVDKRGEDFIGQEILSGELAYRVSVLDDEDSQPSIKIEHYQHGDQDWELMCEFEFVFNQDFTLDKIKFSENPNYQIDEIALRKTKNQQKWGLQRFVDDEGNKEMESASIKDSMLANYLRLGVMRNYFKTFLSSKDVFDLLIPIVLNVALFLVWLIIVLFAA
ncbi:hypothetical protein [uncultured Shewanella sp.]|uniref:hypothetical protein n=1 Tax=uncultured Shewanella sp. TaxID=173975 RepID=UPI00262FA949|nr:hypothetical protein [uncultured Shewanella sp.]